MKKNSRYAEFMKIVKDHPEWKKAIDGARNEKGETAINALLAVLAFFGFVTNQKARIVFESLALLLAVSLYLKKNVLDDPRVKAWLMKALDTVSEKGTRYYGVIHRFFDTKLRASRFS
jgi:hypothetical protein